MGEALRSRLKQTRFDSSHHEVLLNVLVAADHVKSRFTRALRPRGISLTQYNVLRILRGAGDAGHSRCAIAERMLDHSPDVTRILDRLERAGLVRRSPGRADRRTSVARITPRGLAALEALESPLRRGAQEVGSRLSEPERRELCRLLEKLYAEPRTPAEPARRPAAASNR